MKFKNLLLAGVLSTSMGLGMMMNPTIIQAEESSNEVSSYEKAAFENLSPVLMYVNMDDMFAKIVNFNELEIGGFYSLDYQDLVEDKSINSGTANYYHTTFESLNPDVIQFFTENGPVNVMESVDEGMMQHSDARFSVEKAGTAKIKCTIYEIGHPENTKTETITLTIKEANNIDIKNIDFAISDSAMEFKPTYVVYVRDDFYEYTATSAVDDFEYYWKNLTPEIASIYKSGGKEGGEPIIEGEATRGAILFKALAPGKAIFQCTIVKGNESRIVELSVDVKAKKGEEIIPPVNKNEISYTGSKDILADETLKNEVINTIKNANSSVTINLGIKKDLNEVTLPKEVLEAAKEKDIPLTVNVAKDGKTTTWLFYSIDNVSDINLAMTVTNTESIKDLNDKDGLVLNFYHNGKLPTSTLVRTYVGDKFKARDKVTLSYFNESKNTLEETKEYTVDIDGYVTVKINHCSKYVLQAVTKTPVTPENKPVTEPTKPTTPSNGTGNKDAIKDTSNVNNNDSNNTIALLGLMMISICGIVVFRKKADQI